MLEAMGVLLLALVEAAKRLWPLTLLALWIVLIFVCCYLGGN